MVGIDIKKCFDLNIAGLLFGGEGGNGLATGENILQELKKVLPQKMKELPENFFIVVNNCDTRKVEYITPKSHPDEDLALVVRASMSIPILFKPEKIGSYFYCDGGTRDNNPFDYFAIKAPQLKSIGVKLNNSFIGSQRKPYDSLWNMALYTIESMMDSLNIEHQADAITTEIVEITNNENGVNFDLTTQDIYRLWDDGAAQAEKYFK
jgi:predicted acylesterase/phospholipase RssA